MLRHAKGKIMIQLISGANVRKEELVAGTVIFIPRKWIKIFLNDLKIGLTAK